MEDFGDFGDEQLLDPGNFALEVNEGRFAGDAQSDWLSTFSDEPPDEYDEMRDEIWG